VLYFRPPGNRFKKASKANCFGMIELELLVRELERLQSKEKSMRKRIMLEGAIKSIKDYSKETN